MLCIDQDGRNGALPHYVRFQEMAKPTCGTGVGAKRTTEAGRKPKVWFQDARMQFQTFTSKALFRRRGFIGLVNEAERLYETRSNVAICAYPWGIVICVTVNTTGVRQPNAFCHI
jgi:hypothetical protein